MGLEEILVQLDKSEAQFHGETGKTERETGGRIQTRGER
jgi:hypothetical protein